jgi:hypothetical protein
MRKQIGLKLDTELLKRVDEARGITPRTAWIELALQAKLREAPSLEPTPDSDVFKAADPTTYEQRVKELSKTLPRSTAERIAKLET